MAAAYPLILASTSPYRRELLARLHLEFDVVAPEVDEVALAGETPRELAQRLALVKAQAVAQRFPQAVVIGSDQVADLEGHAIGKPGTREAAVRQLQTMQGRTIHFQTAVAVVHVATGFERSALETVEVDMRELTDLDIERYLALEPAFDCAGSAKCEGLGIALMKAIRSDDPTALVGLPLIRTAELLRAAGCDPLRAAHGE